jgi:putative transposase
MSRMSRIVVPGCPHHIIQRGNRKQPVFFSASDRDTYIRLLHDESVRYGIKIWAYCLMDNHVHLIAVPERSDSLAKGIGEAHKKYTSMINRREGWKGYLWQGRFSSFPLDRMYLLAAVRYIEMNPVHAGLVKQAEEYQWSSAKAHVYVVKDLLLTGDVLVDEIGDWKMYLSCFDDCDIETKILKHSATGRPLGNKQFIDKLEKLTGRSLKKGRPGPKTGVEIIK